MAVAAAAAVEPLERYLSPAEAARRVGVTPARIIQLTRAGRLPYVQTSLGRLIEPAAVDALAAERQTASAGTRGEVAG